MCQLNLNETGKKIHKQKPHLVLLSILTSLLHGILKLKNSLRFSSNTIVLQMKTMIHPESKAICPRSISDAFSLADTFS